MTAELIHRLHFAFTITFHYLFPQLTMGLALLIVVLKTVRSAPAAKSGTRPPASGAASSASTSSSASSPAFPWSLSSAPTGRASRGSPAASSASRWRWKASSASSLSRHSSASSSTARSAFPKTMHWFSAVMVFAGSWISGFFIIVTDAWMQHPVAYDRLPNGQFEVAQLLAAASQSVGSVSNTCTT